MAFIAGGMLGLAGGLVWARDAAVGPAVVKQPPMVVPRGVPAAVEEPSGSAPQLTEAADCRPSDLEALLRAVTLGCDCPLPPPENLEAGYHSGEVEAWLERVEEECPVLDERSTVLDCSEWPCMLFVEMAEPSEWRVDDLAGELFCGGDEELNLISSGNAGSSVDDLHHVFVVRPEEYPEYHSRETVRMMRFAGADQE